MSSYQVVKLGEKLSAKYKLSEEERKILTHIDNSKYHMLNINDVTPENTETVNRLLDKGMIRYQKAHGVFPAGFAVTVTGSYALGIFDNDTL